ncbi:MAG TPA: hypothetical protein VH558_07815 [Pseudolabrys sp.]
MPTETTARAQQLQPGAPDEADYHAFCEALSASARGRAFLAEYARRNRNADTRPLLTAIERLQTSLATDPAAPAEILIKQKLRALLDHIGAAQNEIEASVMAIRTAKLADLLAVIEQRLAEIMAPAAMQAAMRDSVLSEEAEETHTHLAVVPPPDQPELPIPSPEATQSPAIALVRNEEVVTEVAFVQSGPSVRAEHAGPVAATGDSAAAVAAPMDPLASIMALSEEERLAMFT